VYSDLSRVVETGETGAMVRYLGVRE